MRYPNKNIAKAKSWLYAVIICSAIFGCLWQGWNNKFPYNGVWSGQETRDKDGVTNHLQLEFTNDGQCHINGSDDMGLHALPCSYRMIGSQAILTMKISGILIRGDIYDSIITSVVTPQQKGAKLLMQGQTYVYIEEKSGKQHTENYKAAMILHRIKP